MHLLVRRELGTDVLAGATDGMAARAKVLELVLGGLSGPLVVLDFAGVSVCTASFLREFVFGLRTSLRSERPGAQVVVANMESRVEEELRIIARSLDTAVALCRWTRKGAEQPRVIGSIEPSQVKTLVILIRLGEADASTLQKADASDPAGTTAWNNRLSGLYEKGLVIETRIDRRKVYRPVLGGLSIGS